MVATFCPPKNVPFVLLLPVILLDHYTSLYAPKICRAFDGEVGIIAFLK